ncbi:AAA family ATPase [Pseudorhodoplanes sp.]|uniref:AAA family ATPase n=1 Tax=Pseudorhodoplanes sp. TaxID=1934341 RepID=UPI003D1354E6
MRISRVMLSEFRRFSDLEIKDVPDTARLVVLAGPNGCGKSSLFDAFSVWHQINARRSWQNDTSYYYKGNSRAEDIQKRISLEVSDAADPTHKASFYFRTAYRNDPEFSLDRLNRMPPIEEEIRIHRMIESDAVVTQNYQRLASQAFEDVFANESAETTIGEFREKVIGDIREATKRLFPELVLNSLGNPLAKGTFRFDKGATKGFEYKNLSGGEKAAFDLILDFVVKKRIYSDSVYCIDEPEAHMNTRLQGALLGELFRLLPERSQLWVATHSIGMMRKARELHDENLGRVAFLDFGGHDFDQAVVITPSRPTRAFWEGVLNVALDDLANLVAPREVIVCEGNPAGAIPGKNAEHDATIYNTVFGDEMPDAKFVASGNSKEVAADRLGFVAALPKLAIGIKVRRLIDRDDHAPADVQKMKRDGITTLGRRHLEAYLYDDEVLAALCESVGKALEAKNVIADKAQAVAASVARNNPHDDIKSAAGAIYDKTKRRLGLTGIGNDQMAFARNTLAPLLKPGMAGDADLMRDWFGL